MGFPQGYQHDRFSTFHYLTNASENLFQSVVSIPNSNEGLDALFAESPISGMRLLVGTGSSLPGFSSSLTVDTLGLWSANRSGEIVVTADLTNPNNPTSSQRRGIWRGDTTGAFELVASEGDFLAGLPRGVSLGLDPQGNSFISISETGRIAFLAQQNNGFEQSLVVADPDGSARALLNQGQRIGQSNEFTVGLFGPPVISDGSISGGQVLVRASVSPVSNQFHRINALISAGNSPQILLREGATTPGLPSQTTLAQLGGFEIQPDDSTLIGLRIEGQSIDSFNDEGVYSLQPTGEVELLLNEGTELSNLPGVVLGSFDGRPNSFDGPVRYDEGFLVKSKLRGPGISQGFGRDEGLVYVEDTGEVILIAKDGDPYFLGGQLSALFGPSYRNFAPLGSGLAPSGFLAFSTDDAVLTTRIPEPLSLVITLLCAQGWLASSRVR